jgi:uncharacterized delta-60 repeat protein
LPDGSLDATFGGDGVVITSFESNNAVGQAVVVQPDGKIVVGGYVIADTLAFALRRYLPDGNLDTSFSGDGKLTTDVGSAISALACNSTAR